MLFIFFLFHFIDFLFSQYKLIFLYLFALYCINTNVGVKCD